MTGPRVSRHGGTVPFHRSPRLTRCRPEDPDLPVDLPHPRGGHSRLQDGGWSGNGTPRAEGVEGTGLVVGDGRVGPAELRTRPGRRGEWDGTSRDRGGVPGSTEEGRTRRTRGRTLGGCESGPSTPRTFGPPVHTAAVLKSGPRGTVHQDSGSVDDTEGALRRSGRKDKDNITLEGGKGRAWYFPFLFFCFF